MDTTTERYATLTDGEGGHVGTYDQAARVYVLTPGEAWRALQPHHTQPLYTDGVMYTRARSEYYPAQIPPADYGTPAELADAAEAYAADYHYDIPEA